MKTQKGPKNCFKAPSKALCEEPVASTALAYANPQKKRKIGTHFHSEVKVPLADVINRCWNTWRRKDTILCVRAYNVRQHPGVPELASKSSVPEPVKNIGPRKKKKIQKAKAADAPKTKKQEANNEKIRLIELKDIEIFKAKIPDTSGVEFEPFDTQEAMDPEIVLPEAGPVSLSLVERYSAVFHLLTY